MGTPRLHGSATAYRPPSDMNIDELEAHSSPSPYLYYCLCFIIFKGKGICVTPHLFNRYNYIVYLA